MSGKWVNVAKATEIPEGEREFFDVDGREIAVLNVGGEYYAVGNFCPHMGGPVGNGPVRETADRNVIMCPFHEWRFDLDTGDAVFPGKQRIKKYEVSLEKYDVDVDEGEIFVEV